MNPNTRPLTEEELNMREALSGRAEPTQSEYTKETISLRAYFHVDTYCELMFPYNANADLLPNADPYTNSTVEAFRQFRLEAKV